MSPPKPLVAIVGRPNVGKSTLANRIVGRRAAVVQEKPGVTRDRREFPAEWNGRSFTVVDTGGWQQGRDAGLVEDICIQAELAVAAADLILFVIDAQGGITSDDAAVARLLRPETDRVVMVANKADNDTLSRESATFTRLGLGEPLPVSAIHGHGVADLLDVLVRRLPDPADRDIVEDPVPDVAVIGRPNVGKSTLLNRLVGNERVLVSPVPGTTRDPIDVMIRLDGTGYRLIDTAGMRRKPKISEDVEFFSVLRAREVLRRAHAALLMVDAADGVTHQGPANRPPGRRFGGRPGDPGEQVGRSRPRATGTDHVRNGKQVGLRRLGAGSPRVGPHRRAPAPAGSGAGDGAREPIPPDSHCRSQQARHRPGRRAPASHEEGAPPQESSSPRNPGRSLRPSPCSSREERSTARTCDSWRGGSAGPTTSRARRCGWWCAVAPGAAAADDPPGRPRPQRPSPRGSAQLQADDRTGGPVPRLAAGAGSDGPLPMGALRARDRMVGRAGGI